MIMLIIALIMVPIFAGYLFLLTWPVWVCGYVGAMAMLRGHLSRSVLRVAAKARRSQSVWELMENRKMIPWRDISSSMELSCKDQTVSRWMRKLGVQEVDNLQTDSNSTFSNSYPSDYDLVTNIFDERNQRNLNPLYSQAADYLKTGGTFIDIERGRCEHKIRDHIAAAERNGFSLSERSDRPLLIWPEMGLASWLPKLTELRNLSGVMLVWTKTQPG